MCVYGFANDKDPCLKGVRDVLHGVEVRVRGGVQVCVEVDGTTVCCCVCDCDLGYTHQAEYKDDDGGTH